MNHVFYNMAAHLYSMADQKQADKVSREWKAEQEKQRKERWARLIAAGKAEAAKSNG